MSLTEIHEMIVDAEAAEMEKVAEEDAAQRIMARGFMDELDKLAESDMDKALALASSKGPPKRSGAASSGGSNINPRAKRVAAVSMPKGNRRFGGPEYRGGTVRPFIQAPPAGKSQHPRGARMVNAELDKGRTPKTMRNWQGYDSGKRIFEPNK